ncbi:MAG: carboxylating nicotinate-nucleotide diphosphorylase [bacterium]
MKLSQFQIEDIVRRALVEDVGSGDITTDSIVPVNTFAAATIIAREAGIIAGGDVAKLVFSLVDRRIVYSPLVQDSEEADAGQPVATVEGPGMGILTGERVALNFLQHLSGIATTTARLAAKIKYYNAKITDTRKTTPGLRLLEKYAIRVGGGFNHRRGLYDAVVIKDNHLRLSGGIKQAVALSRENTPHTMRIEVEVNSLAQVEEALDARVDIIMLNSMPPEQIKEVVQKVDGRAIIEVSGDISGDKIVEIAKTGVDYISLDSLTDAFNRLDLVLQIGEVKSGPGGEVPPVEGGIAESVE